MCIRDRFRQDCDQGDCIVGREKLHRFPVLFSFQKTGRYQLFQNTGTSGRCPQTFSLGFLRHILFSGSLHCGQQGILRKVLRWTAFTFFDDCRSNRKGLSFGQLRQSFLCEMCIRDRLKVSYINCWIYFLSIQVAPRRTSISDASRSLGWAAVRASTLTA